MISLGKAAAQLKVSKAAVSRAISRGELSAARRPDKSFAIDPAELARWWEGVQHRYRGLRGDQATPAPNGAGNGSNGADNTVAIALARAEAEIAGLREMLRMRDELVGDLRGERDKLIGQVDTAHKLLTHQRAPAESPRQSVPRVTVISRSWWPWRRAG